MGSKGPIYKLAESSYKDLLILKLNYRHIYISKLHYNQQQGAAKFLTTLQLFFHFLPIESSARSYLIHPHCDVIAPPPIL